MLKGEKWEEKQRIVGKVLGKRERRVGEGGEVGGVGRRMIC